MSYPKIAVFSGFRGVTHTNGKKTSEKDLVYRILEVLHSGKLRKSSLRKGVGESMAAKSPLFDKFYFAEELGEGTPVEADMKLLKECDFALVILPNRKTATNDPNSDFPTSIYALMEYGLVCGAGVPGILIPERGLPVDQLGFATHLHRFPSDVDDTTIRDNTQQAKLKALFEMNLQAFYLKKPWVSGLPRYEVDKFYRDYLIPLLLQWHDVRIYNHSVLPLSSSFDPTNRGPSEASPWYSFRDVQDYYKNQPHRALYFESEEAILSGSTVRVERLIDALGSRAFSASLLGKVCDRNKIRKLQNGFSLTRYASIIPSELYGILKDEEEKQRVLARDLSIFLQMFRLQRRSTGSKRVNYHLYGFRTFYPYSMPTTVYAEHRRKESGSLQKQKFGVWGFLRSTGSLDPNERDDAFIVARNSSCVDVWERHLDEVGKNTSNREPRLLFSPGHRADFGAFFDLVGDEIKDLLREEIIRKKWRTVLKETGLGSAKTITAAA